MSPDGEKKRGALHISYLIAGASLVLIFPFGVSGLAFGYTPGWILASHSRFCPPLYTFHGAWMILSMNYDITCSVLFATLPMIEILNLSNENVAGWT